ncbi:syntaphilin isoform X2 [Protopterus annectens]|uniref:syntaphilin isoform X2 n=1 Tax=Protopterus annectens TaxID=7888 RepID=UPI001CFA4979|nr:syntaphilin isoform X2 [Protopterus annectens]
MSLPGSRRQSTGSRRYDGSWDRRNPYKADVNKTLPPHWRLSPPVTIRDGFATSSMSSSSNSGSCKGSDGSPTPRRSIKYSCSDNHGIKPPTPEQYLTPLQQKEVCIRHLKARLKDFQERLQDRDIEVDELKAQLSRMQEDWIEEECHRVEAQLALKEARKEIKQLKQVIDTVRSNLTENDKGIQKYFIDISIQNTKLETLLQNMEVAQNGTLRDEVTGSAGGSPARSLTRSSTYTKLSDQAAQDKNAGDFQSISTEETGDSGFVGAEDTYSRTDLLDQFSSRLDCSAEDASLPMSFMTMSSRLPHSSTYEKLASSHCSIEMGIQATDVEERAIQTDFVQYNPDLDTIMEKVMKSQACSPSSQTSLWASEIEDLGINVSYQVSNTNKVLDLVPSDPNSAIVVTDKEGNELSSSHVDTSVILKPTVQQPTSMNMADSAIYNIDEDPSEPDQDVVPQKSYWSRHFLIDFLAVAVPIVPTVAWLCRTQRWQGQPVYNIGSLLRGCCTVTLHSIRRMGCRPASRNSQV